MKPLPKKHIILAITLGIITTITIAWCLEIMWANNYGSLNKNFRAELLLSEHHTQRVRWQQGSGRFMVWWDYYDPSINVYIVADGAVLPPSQEVDWSQVPSEVLSLCPYATITRTDFLMGWPKVALSYGKQEWTTNTMDHGIELNWNNRTYWLPLKPYWPGFLIDTAIYSSIWFGILIFPTTFRHHLRTHQNRCTTCGYNLHNLKSNRCPECGTKINRKKLSTKKQ